MIQPTEQQMTEQKKTIQNVGSEDVPQITGEKIIFALKTLKNNKSTGMDNIFPEMLKENGPRLITQMKESTPCKHPVIVLQDVAWTDLHALVEFIYHGEVNVHQRSLSSFLKTAEVLRVSGLTQQHGEDREQLAQVQSLVRYPQTPPVSNSHPPNFTDKLVSDSLFTSPSSPPHGATVNQLLRRAAMQHRRERRISMDPENEHKRVRSEHIIGNNNNNELNLSQHTMPGTHPPPQTQPADFSPSAMKHNALNLNLNSLHKEFEGNGISSTERENSPISPSPPSSGTQARCNENNVKSEPMELLCSTNNQDDNSNDSGDTVAPNDNGPTNLPQGPHSGSSAGDHDDHDSPLGAPPYLTDSKLFATAASGFNFTMAALAADHSALGGLNQSLTGSDTLAGTSQGASPKKVFTCQLCGKVLCSKASLKRHIADKHAERQEEYRCVICERVYCSRNSLMTHIYTYHKSRPGDIDIKFF
ncbi:hypothetical protein HHI36_015650 [Cryptolaemus montrouzieri]|uniref:Broad-complex n=1 Tax=Cryptolaemus montrouzieri TaxID=559131 RepID=A0ABD2N6M4_9CUCU